MADCGGENVVMEETMRTETDEIRDNLKYLTLLAGLSFAGGGGQRDHQHAGTAQAAQGVPSTS